MYDEEKSAGAEWTKELKREVAEASSVQVSDVNDLLAKY